MFDDTLKKYALVIGLFVVFVILGNLFAAKHQAGGRRVAAFRRKDRRQRKREIAEGPRGQPGDTEADEPPQGDDPDVDLTEEDKASLKRRLAPQIALSAIAVLLAGLSFFVMWHVARSG